jgi:hypothetical protein
MDDLVFTSLVLIVGGLVHGAVLKRHEPKEGRLLTFGFVAHVGSGLAQILLYRFYYAGGDMTAYFDFGVPIAEALREDFGPLFPLTVEVFFHEESRLPFETLGGSSTGTMLMVAVWLLFLLGNSLAAATVLVSIFSYLSKVLIYRVLRDHFDEEHRPTVLVASLLVPSAVFWTSALLKEPVMMVFLGPLFLALRWILEGRRLWLAAVLAAGGGIGVWLLKPYVLVSFAAAAGMWVIWQRVLKQRGKIVVKPIYLAGGLALSVGAFTAADRYLPKSENQSVVDAMAVQRRASALEEGGSNFYLEEPSQGGGTESRVSLASQLALAPLALVTAYFRPFIFEARNSVQAVNALETTWILALFVQVLRRNKWTELVLRVLNSPALLFSFTFSLVMALGTGLSTANLGTLSRYRAPMMPFAVLLLLTLRKTDVARTRVVQLSAPESEVVRD